ncbi:hypothetical protein D3C71_1935960 [compost metagenome]
MVLNSPESRLRLTCWCCATSRFSITVMPLNRRTFWKVRTTPWLATAWLGRPAMDCPLSVMAPSVGL